jgi:hypothetical protein
MVGHLSTVLLVMHVPLIYAFTMSVVLLCSLR